MGSCMSRMSARAATASSGSSPAPPPQPMPPPGAAAAAAASEVPPGHNAMAAHPDDDLLKQAMNQRRRLSVTPAMVGDIDGKRLNPSENAGSGRRLSLGAEVPEADAALPMLANEEAAVSGGKYIAVSKKGFVPYNRKKTNQDAFFIEHHLGPDKDVSAFGVCDGHGEFGHHVSAFVRENIAKHLSKQKSLKVKPEKSITVAVEDMCRQLEKSHINLAFSGTTLVFGMRIADHMYVANIGDSRCVVARIDGDEIVAQALSRDQKPDDPDEKQRIIKAGGRVEPLPGPPTEDLGPSRVWLSEVDVPGLAMSRSIGDEISHTVGVISQPEINNYLISEKDSFMIWASDGVWEFLSNQEVVELVHSHLPDLDTAARTLVSLSSKKWQEVEEVIDDITVVILTLR